MPTESISISFEEGIAKILKSNKWSKYHYKSTSDYVNRATYEKMKADGIIK